MYFLIFVIISSLCFASDIEFQQDLDFGDVPVGNGSMPNIKMLPFTITNNSSDDYLIEHMLVRNNYPDSIPNVIQFIPGYIYKYVNGPLIIKPNTSVILNVAYNSHIVDEISKSGSKLSKTVSIFYRKVNETIYTEDSVKMFARSIKSNGIETFGFKYDFYFCPSGSKYLSDNYFVTLINNTGKKVKIDSVQVSIDGDNLSEIGLIDENGNPINIVEQNSFARYVFTFDFVKFEKSVGKVKYFVTEIDSPNKQYISEDSTIVNYIPADEEGRIVLSNRMIISYPGEIKKTILKVLTCSMQDFIVDSIYFKQNQKYDEFSMTPNGDSFPIYLNQDEIKNIQIEIKAGKAGTRESQICADFRNAEGEIISKCIELIIHVMNPTDVHQTFENLNLIKIFPNPADEKIKIVLDYNLGMLISGIDIYDIMGKPMYCSFSISGTASEINTSNFSIGPYICIIKLSNGKIIHSKILISR